MTSHVNMFIYSFHFYITINLRHGKSFACQQRAQYSSSSIMNHMKVDFFVMATTTTVLLSISFLRVVHAMSADNTTIQIPDEKRLRDELLRVSSWTVRPVENYTDRLDINLRFRLTRVAELVRHSYIQYFSLSSY